MLSSFPEWETEDDKIAVWSVSVCLTTILFSPLWALDANSSSTVVSSRHFSLHTQLNKTRSSMKARTT